MVDVDGLIDWYFDGLVDYCNFVNWYLTYYLARLQHFNEIAYSSP